MKRKHISRKASSRQFRRVAAKINPKNLAPAPMRGGIRA